jgi:hypothetical protein
MMIFGLEGYRRDLVGGLVFGIVSSTLKSIGEGRSHHIVSLA